MGLEGVVTLTLSDYAQREQLPPWEAVHPVELAPFPRTSIEEPGRDRQAKLRLGRVPLMERGRIVIG